MAQTKITTRSEPGFESPWGRHADNQQLPSQRSKNVAASKFARRVTLAIDCGSRAYPRTLDIASEHADAETACRHAVEIGRKAFGARLVAVTTPGFWMLAEPTPFAFLSLCAGPGVLDAYALARGSS